jgi:poly(3-hydroxybutyrate) depolymerase
MLNERKIWQEEVESHFQEGMAHLKDFHGSDMTDDGYKEKLLVSYLSDIQELIVLNPEKASEHINRIKFMINNCY